MQVVSPKEYVEKIAPSGAKHDVVIFDGATPAQPPRAQRDLPRPARTRLAGEGRGRAEAARLRRIERKHPIVRWTALDDVNIVARPQARRRARRQGRRRERPGADPRRRAARRASSSSRIGLRHARQRSAAARRVAAAPPQQHQLVHRRGLAVHLELPHRRRVARARRVEQRAGAAQGARRRASCFVPVHEGRAVYLGERAGFYELSGAEGSDTAAAGPERGRARARARARPEAGRPATTGSFAANLLDAEESSIEPAKELVVDGKKAGTLGGFQIGVRREIWIYLLLAAILLTPSSGSRTTGGSPYEPRRLIWAAIVAAIVAAGWFVGDGASSPWLTPELYVTFLVALGCAFLAARSIVEMVASLRARREVDKSRLAFGVAARRRRPRRRVVLLEGRAPPGAATLAWKRDGTDYELLAPKMLGLALLAPFFLWMIGRSLADLPWPQRILSAFLRIAFVALLALGLVAPRAHGDHPEGLHRLPRRRLRVGARRRDRGRARRDQEGPRRRSRRTRSSASSRSRSGRASCPIADDAKEAPALERHDVDATRRGRPEGRGKRTGPRRRDRPRERDAARVRPVSRRATCAAPSSSPTACRPTATSSPRRTARASSA